MKAITKNKKKWYFIKVAFPGRFHLVENFSCSFKNYSLCPEFFAKFPEVNNEF